MSEDTPLFEKDYAPPCFWRLHTTAAALASLRQRPLKLLPEPPWLFNERRLWQWLAGALAAGGPGLPGSASQPGQAWLAKPA